MLLAQGITFPSANSIYAILTDGSLRAGDLVDEIDDALVRNAAIGFQTHLAGAAVAVAHLDIFVL